MLIALQDCTSQKNVMVCVTPDITEHVSGPKCVIAAKSVNKRSVPQISFVRSKRGEQVKAVPADYSGIYAQYGFLFDGIKKYSRINNSSRVMVYEEPFFFSLMNGSEVIRVTDDSLILSGRFLTLCCNISDYQVLVGEEPCPIQGIADSEMECKLSAFWKSAKIGTKRNVTVSCDYQRTYRLAKINLGHM